MGEKIIDTNSNFESRTWIKKLSGGTCKGNRPTGGTAVLNQNQDGGFKGLHDARRADGRIADIVELFV
jgi:hypothetical protein